MENSRDLSSSNAQNTSGMPYAKNGSKMSLATLRNNRSAWPDNILNRDWIDDITGEQYEKCLTKLRYSYPCYASSWMYGALTDVVSTLQGDFQLIDSPMFRSDVQCIIAFDCFGVGYCWCKNVYRR